MYEAVWKFKVLIEGTNSVLEVQGPTRNIEVSLEVQGSAWSYKVPVESTRFLLEIQGSYGTHKAHVGCTSATCSSQGVWICKSVGL